MKYFEKFQKMLEKGAQGKRATKRRKERKKNVKDKTDRQSDKCNGFTRGIERKKKKSNIIISLIFTT